MSEEELLFRPEVEKVTREFSNFAAESFITRPGLGFTGRIAEDILRDRKGLN